MKAVARAARPEPARGKPAQRRSACACLSRPRPLLYLSHPHSFRLERPSSDERGRADGARARRRGSRRAARLLAAANPRHRLRAPMLPAHATVAEVNRSWPAGAGDERYLVVMFVDMPGLTRLARGRL